MANGNAGHAGAAGFDVGRARHEAAHAVVIDDLGYHVLRVNISPAEPQLTQVDWGTFEAAVQGTNWNDPVQRYSIRPRVLGYVTMLVAGHLAQNIEDNVTERVSTRIQNAPGLLNNPPNMQQAVADRDRTALFLRLVQRHTMEYVTAAEARATEILARRQANYQALRDLLIQNGTVEVADLDNLLGYGPD